VNEEQSRRLIACGENIKETAWTGPISLIQHTFAARAHDRAPALVILIDRVALRVPFAQRELGFKRLVDHCQGIIQIHLRV
jgi:hypothetical protein